ncbi:GIN domain-containing protein [Microbulbifer sp. SSSA002]|uniref:GIN domain-containing protein n=1 Tax=unclassified Microbulbifer TaxID=2619833 RepID=UPI004039836D
MMILKKTLFAPLLAVLATVATYCANAQADEMETKHFDVEGFTQVSLKGSSHLKLIQGDSFEVVADGPASTMPYVKVEVKGERLELSVEENTRNLFGFVTISHGQGDKVNFTVTMPKVEALKVTGSGKARSSSIESENLTLGVTGSGLINIDKAATENLTAYITGSGDLLLNRALTVKGDISVRGSGDMKIGRITGETLAAEIQGSGDILVDGRTADVSVRVMGSGDFVGRSLRTDRAEGSIMGSGDIVLKRPGRDSFSVMGSGDVVLID